MPCESAYLAPHDFEKQLQRAARVYVWLLTELDRPVPARVRHAAGSIYGDDANGELVDVVPDVCELLRSLPKKVYQKVILDQLATSKQARRCLDWWEAHQKADAAREARERKAKERKRVKVAALKKLTAAERKALNVVAED